MKKTEVPTEAIRVMIVDDHPVVRDGIRANLGDAKNVVVVGEAGSGEEALSLAAELEPDIVTMDLKLPDMSGLEATERLLASMPSLQVVILSMYADRNYVLQSVKSGARGYLLKDGSADHLVPALMQVHRGGAFFDPSVSEYILNPDSEAESQEAELTERETEVLTHIAEGLSNKEIAAKLFLSVRTVEAHRENLMRKLDIHGAAALTRYAIEQGLVQVDLPPHEQAP